MNASVSFGEVKENWNDFSLQIPTRLVFGAGKLSELGKETSRIGSRALVVAMPIMEQLGCLGRAMDSLKEAGLEISLWSKIRENPRSQDADEAFQVVKSRGCDCVVALGGGSTIDLAKAIAVIAKTKPPAWDYVYTETKRKVTGALPVVSVPTTAGTGSHMTGYAVISNDELGIKSTIVSPMICPTASIVDPKLTSDLDPGLTASTGFDAFSHSFESYINRNSSVATDMMAERALPLILHHLPLAVKDPANLESRMALAWADTLAGILIFNSGTTLPHALGQALSGKFHRIRHGPSLAAIYPAFMMFSYKGRPDGFSKLASWMRKRTSSGSEGDAAKESVSGSWTSCAESTLP